MLFRVSRSQTESQRETIQEQRRITRNVLDVEHRPRSTRPVLEVEKCILGNESKIQLIKKPKNTRQRTEPTVHFLIDIERDLLNSQVSAISKSLEIQPQHLSKPKESNSQPNGSSASNAEIAHVS